MPLRVWTWERDKNDAALHRRRTNLEPCWFCGADWYTREYARDGTPVGVFCDRRCLHQWEAGARNIYSKK
jgi:hypothetical protein